MISYYHQSPFVVNLVTTFNLIFPTTFYLSKVQEQLLMCEQNIECMDSLYITFTHTISLDKITNVLSLTESLTSL